MKVVAVVLTANEALHLDRCLDSLHGVASDVLVVDSFSTDQTVEIARSRGARVLQHPWVNYATQFNWALGQVDRDADWILRIDADEILTSSLSQEIQDKLASMPPSVDGIFWSRRMTFQGRLIRHGGVFPVRVLRLFRHGRGRCENRWMDEHIKVDGPTVDFSGEMIDDNLNTLTWWIDKHNKYASREAIDLLNLEFGFMPHDTVASLARRNEAASKRWLKEVVYARLPAGFRAAAYFAYRYVLRLGFLDGSAGTSFHFLQGFWYRYLVDAKIAEVKRAMRYRRLGVTEAIHQVLGLRI